MTVKWVLAHLCLLGYLQCALNGSSVKPSEFQLEGDYLIGGLFDIHKVPKRSPNETQEFISCSSERLILSSYRRFQLMRFSVEEINNSTSLLPNVSLGYEIFDHCSDTKNFPNILNLMSVNGIIKPWNVSLNLSKVISVVGTYTSTATLAFAPLFMTDLTPVISYGAASSVFSIKQNFPSFLRTLHPNQHVIKLVLKILEHFDWRWVSFLFIDDDYGKDGQDLFIKSIEDTEICMAYTKGIHQDTNYPRIFRQIESLKVNVIIVFAPEWTAEALIESAIEQNFTNRVWIAGDAWSLHKELPKKKGIRNIGTVLGVAEPKMTIPGFNDFIYSSKAQRRCENAEHGMFCSQIYNCSTVTAEDVITADPSFNFPVYSALYAIAHALHAVLKCGNGRCDKNIKVYPHMVLTALKSSNFTLLNQTVQFDDNSDPKFGSYSIVFWNHSGDVEEVGSYSFYPPIPLFIDKDKIKWPKGKKPESVCSKKCPAGYERKQEGVHKCCFNCTKCPEGTYINNNTDSSKCIRCKHTEWSAAGSTSCNLRLVEYVPFTDAGAIVTMIGALGLVGLSVATSVLFAINYNTPVVKSAGGPMCFLILGCLSLSSLSVFFSFGEPSIASCVLRFLPFLLFFTVCVACFAARSFQIVSIFKIAAKFPKVLDVWKKYHGQWLLIAVAFITQTILVVIGYSTNTPKPNNETLWHPHEIILHCKFNTKEMSGSVFFISSLCVLSFIFSYMGKNLPKNYNEAKAITFCFFMLIVIWIMFATTRILYHGKYTEVFNALAVLCSLYSFLSWYFLPKCYIIIFQPQKNTQQYFQSVIKNFTTNTQ